MGKGNLLTVQYFSDLNISSRDFSFYRRRLMPPNHRYHFFNQLNHFFQTSQDFIQFVFSQRALTASLRLAQISSRLRISGLCINRHCCHRGGTLWCSPCCRRAVVMIEKVLLCAFAGYWRVAKCMKCAGVYLCMNDQITWSGLQDQDVHVEAGCPLYVIER